jgi:hypothetical protein
MISPVFDFIIYGNRLLIIISLSIYPCNWIGHSLEVSSVYLCFNTNYVQRSLVMIKILKRWGGGDEHGILNGKKKLPKSNNHLTTNNEMEISASANGGPRPRLRRLDGSARSPIDTSGNFPAHLSAEAPLNISPNLSEVKSDISELEDNFSKYPSCPPKYVIVQGVGGFPE